MSPVDYLEQLQAQQPALAEDIAELASLYQRKLWHQLTLKVEECFSKPEFNTNGLPLQLYDGFVADFGTKLNLLKLAQFAVHVSKHIAEPGQTVAFLEKVVAGLKEAKLPRSEQPLLFLHMHVAQQLLEMGQVRAAWAGAAAAAAAAAGSTVWHVTACDACRTCACTSTQQQQHAGAAVPPFTPLPSRSAPHSAGAGVQGCCRKGARRAGRACRRGPVRVCCGALRRQPVLQGAARRHPAMHSRPAAARLSTRRPLACRHGLTLACARRTLPCPAAQQQQPPSPSCARPPNTPSQSSLIHHRTTPR